MSTSPPPQDHYKVLGVARDATLNTIRSVYRKFVLTTHPDKFQDEVIKAKKVEEFHQVQKAYETLSDEKERERYDALCRLAELKAERFREDFSSRRSERQEPGFSPRAPPDRSWGGQSPIFEEIRPREKRSEEPRATNLRSPEARHSPRYEEYHSKTRDYEDYDDFVPAYGTSKKGSPTTRSTDTRQDEGRNSQRGSRLRAAIPKVLEKQRERENEERRRARDKGRRDDGQSKRTHVRIPLEGESVSDMEPELEAFMSYASHRSEGRPRSHEDDKSHSRRKYESRGNSPDRETRIHHNFQSAAEYIAKSIGKVSSDRENKQRRPSLSRAQSTSRSQAVPPPPPPPPLPHSPMPPVEDVSRSSASRKGGSSKQSKSRREPPEIVEPPRKRDLENEPRRPSLNTAATAPSVATLKPLRSATMDSRSSDKPKASFRRVTTSPLAPTTSSSSTNTYSHKHSRSRDSHDSGYSSPDAATEVLSPRTTTTTTTYRIPKQSNGDGEDSSRPEFVLIDPDQRHHSRHESSGRTTSYRGDRSGGSSRHGPSRSHTADDAASQRPPTLSRAATDKPGGMLYREIPRASPEPRESSRVKYTDVRHSRQYGRDDVNYTPYPRRSSPTDMESGGDHHGDAYAEYERKGSLPMRPVRA